MSTVKTFFVDLKNRLDFKFHTADILPLIFVLLTVPAIIWLPIEYTYENHLIENFQLFVLLFGFVSCVKAKTDKSFFNSLALVCVILFLREINCGRTVFFPIEGMDNAFYSWKDIPYGYLVNPIYGVFIASSGLYFIFSKSYQVLFNYVMSAKVAVWSWVFLFMGIIFGTLGEKIGNFALEEMTESLFYLSFVALICMHGHNKEYIEAVNNKN